MADPNFSDLARRAIAAPGWRWMPGMLITDDGAGVRLCWFDDQHMHGVAADGCAWMRLRRDRERVPDLSDPATVGCLLALVREAWSSPDLRVRRVGQRTLWEVERWDHAQVRYVYVADGFSEADALVAALEVSGG